MSSKELESTLPLLSASRRSSFSMPVSVARIVYLQESKAWNAISVSPPTSYHLPLLTSSPTYLYLLLYLLVPPPPLTCSSSPTFSSPTFSSPTFPAPTSPAPTMDIACFLGFCKVFQRQPLVYWFTVRITCKSYSEEQLRASNIQVATQLLIHLRVPWCLWPSNLRIKVLTTVFQPDPNRQFSSSKP